MIHGVKISICQWTGEAIVKKFQIPTKRGNWTGCFGSPSAALAALTSLNKDKTSEEIHELIDKFEASLRREPGQEDTVITIKAAPSYENLRQFGGTQSLEQFHATYQHDKQNVVFKQDVPPNSEKKSRNDKHWLVTSTVTGTTTDALIPSNVNAWKEFLLSFSDFDFETGTMKPVMFYYNPRKPKMFAVGPVGPMDNEPAEKISSIIGMPVKGKNSALYHKFPIVEEKRKREREGGVDVNASMIKKRRMPKKS